MNQSRLAKTLARTAVVSWREQPTQYDIEALRANVERVGLVIKVRWAIVAVLAGFSVVAASIYAMSVDLDVFVRNMTVPAIALVFVLLYNGIYQATYRKVANIAILNPAQLLFDIVVVTVLVYYSGGVYSWFSAMYMLFILESAFILPRKSEVWLLAIAAGLAYAVVLFGEYLGWIPHVSLPFVANELYANLTYVLVRYLWNGTLFAGAALIGMLMMKSIRERERELRESSFVDETTGLFNRPYFHRIVSTELERARRADRELALVLADVDGLGGVNRAFGVEVGDVLLAAIGERLIEVADADKGDWTRSADVACRVGGEEFALLVPEVEPADGSRTPVRERALAAAEEFRRAVEAARASGVGVTVSVGVAVGPHDGESPDALLDAADCMLSVAARAGGNTVRASWLCGGSGDD
ncbi:MAG: GGDEF domain-containing protein [Actinobacteria bacterium]|nr:GGDEF domain-containing protein [Actinomycetota bacterium]